MTTPSNSEEDEFKRELNRRLQIIGSADYNDPAMADIKTSELVLWYVVAAGILATALVLWIGGQ